MKWFALSIVLACVAGGCAAPATIDEVTTFSIVALDPETGEMGIAVASKFLAVGAVVPWSQAEVGAVATQAFANTTFGPRGLRMMADGTASADVLDKLLAEDPDQDHRQVGMVDAAGRVAAFTGSKCLPWAGHRVGKNYCVQGNLLAGEPVLAAMAEAFEKAKGDLGDRLLVALEAGDQAGGDKRGRQSAALLIVRKGAGYGGYNDRYRDLRVDDHAAPIDDLKRLYGLHKQVFPPPEKN